MYEDLNAALSGPRWFLGGILALLALIGLVVLGAIGNHLDVVIPIFIVALLPFLIPYILSFYYPVVAGGILILTGWAPMFFISEFFSSITIGVIFSSIPIAVGIWMIVLSYKKPKKFENNADQPYVHTPDTRTWEN